MNKIESIVRKFIIHHNLFKSRGSHLDAHFVLTGVKLSIKMNAMQRYSEPFAKIDAELFIALALFTTQMKIAMGSAYAHSQLLQDKEQRHAVGST